MNKSLKMFGWMLILSVVCLPVSFAGHSGSDGSHGYSSCGKSSCSSSHGGLEEKFFHKAHFMKSNAEELGLSESQTERIKALKLRVKKDIIRRDADIEIAKVDIKSGLYGHQLDVNSLHQLVDQKYESKKMKAKDMVAAFAELKSILTEEQYEKMKELWHK